LARPTTTASGWKDVQCGVGGHGDQISIPSPIRQLSGEAYVNQVVWARDDNPQQGSAYGKWYIATTDEQYIHPADRNIITITGSGDIKNSSYLDEEYINYPSANLYHQIAWDMQVKDSAGAWSYVSSSWQTPAEYQQWDYAGTSSMPADSCFTYFEG
jgi:hypothetical protein